jgi:pilus assembly protein CpaE
VDSEGNILIVSAEPRTASLIAETLGSNERLRPADACRDVTALAGCLDRQTVAAAVVDLGPNPEQVLGQLAPLIAANVQTRFVLLADEPTNELILEAMQLGARHLMRKDALGKDRMALREVLGRLVTSVSSQAKATGSLITVLSASGGCGATTIAVNLANEFRLGMAGSVLLVDLDAAYGAVSDYLGLEGSYGAAEVLSQSRGADPQLIRSGAQPYTDDLHVLLSPASTSFFEPSALEYANLAPALLACAQAYAYTVVDAPRVPLDVAAVLANAGKAALILMQLTVKDVHMAENMRAALLRRGVAAGKIIFVINRYRKRSFMVSYSAARRALEGGHFLHVRNDFRGARKGINYGQPLAQAAPMCDLRRDVRKLAETLAADQPVAAAGRRGQGVTGDR